MTHVRQRLLRASIAAGVMIGLLGGSALVPEPAYAQSVGLARVTVRRIVEGEPASFGSTALYQIACGFPAGPLGNIRNATGINLSGPGAVEYGGFPIGVDPANFNIYTVLNGVAIFDPRYTGPIPAGLRFGYGTSANIDAGVFASSAFMVATYDATNGLLISPNGPGRFIFVGRQRFYDVRTNPSQLGGGDRLGTPANVGANAAELTRLANEATTRSIELARAEIRAAVQAGPFYRVWDYPAQVPVAFFDYGIQRFRLLPGQAMTFGQEVFPRIRTTSTCEVTELDNDAATATLYSSTVTNPTTFTVTERPGIVGPDGLFRSAMTLANGLETITVTNRYAGSLVVSKAVTGDPKSRIATFEIAVACDRDGPNDTFLLKDRQSKIYTNIFAGTTCVVSERRSDGAFVSFTDNNGPPSDGRVTIRAVGASCAVHCTENVIVTNDYTRPPADPTTTTTIESLPEGAPPRALLQLSLPSGASTPTATAAPTAAAPTSDAPAVAAEPAQAVVAEPNFTG